MKQWILPALERLAPSLPNQIRYHRHVRMRRDFVYQHVTELMFERLDSQTKIGVDVGANLGIFTRYLQAHFHHTVAVEPIPELAHKLVRIFGASVQVENCALGAKNGEIVIRTPVDAFGNVMHALTTASQSNDLKMFEHQSVVEATVPVRRLDDIDCGNGTIGFVKIDVEGFELEVLQGAVSVIARDRPVLMIEISKAHNPDYATTLSFLEEMGYQPLVLTEHGLRKDAVAVIEDQPLSLSRQESGHPAPSFDFLFPPLENLKHLTDLFC